jgi:hypothetical protein
VTPQYGQDGGAADSDVVYVAGDEHSQPSPALIEAVGEHLRRGAWLFADGCGDGDAFANAFVPLLMDQVGERDAEASVLGAHHVFGTPPDGAFPGELRWGPRALVSARDYGCVWCGRGPEAPTPRDRIRDALEFGVNFLAAAAHAHRR